MFESNIISKRYPQLIALIVILTCGTVLASPEKKQAGPQGGLLLKTEPRAEFFVNDERKVEITFLNAEQEVIPPGERNVRVTASTPTGRKVLEFDSQENVFISREPLPEGEGYTVVIQIWQTSGSRPENFRIVYHDYTCGGCDLVEYACTCDH